MASSRSHAARLGGIHAGDHWQSVMRNEAHPLQPWASVSFFPKSFGRMEAAALAKVDQSFRWFPPRLSLDDRQLVPLALRCRKM